MRLMTKTRSMHPLWMAACLALVGCGGPTAQMQEYPPVVRCLSDEPVVFVGRVMESPVGEGALAPSRFNGLPVQLFRVQVDVENVLAGDVSPSPVRIFFYSYVGDLGSSQPSLADLSPGERDVFYLIKDSGQLRMACNQFKDCVTVVWTGAHPNFKKQPNESVDDAIAAITLSRGVGATDSQMIEAIGHGNQIACGREAPLMKQLRILAATETPAVRAVATQLLTDSNATVAVPCQGGKR